MEFLDHEKKQFWLDAATSEMAEQENKIRESAVHSPSHYCNRRTIQPWDVANDWELDFFEGNVLKYLARYKRKGKPIEDLDKAIEYLTFLRNREEARSE